MLLSRGERQRKHRMGKFSAKMKVTLFRVSDVAVALLQAYFCIRSLWRNVRSFGFSCDASRVGNLNRLVGFLTRPQGEGVALPPLVHFVYKIGIRNRRDSERGHTKELGHTKESKLGCAVKPAKTKDFGHGFRPQWSDFRRLSRKIDPHKGFSEETHTKDFSPHRPRIQNTSFV